MVAKTICRAREQFLADGHIQHDLEAAVSPDVLRSWRRSRMSGVKAEVSGLPLVSAEAPASALTIAAEPVLARLAEQFAGIRAGVLLSDRNAHILRRWASDRRGLDHMDKTCSVVGACGAEDVIGTNGIGTVVEERQPSIVVGPEHFADLFMGHVCIGVPIHHPLSRRFEGVVTLSADVAVTSPLLLPLMVGTAREVEQRLLEHSSRKERMLLDAFLLASRRGSATAVIGEGVFMVGPRAAQLLRSIDPSALWFRLHNEFLGATKRTSIVDTGDETVELTYEPVVVDDHLVGAVLDVVPESDLAIHATGSHPPGKSAEQPKARRRDTDGWSEGQRTLPGRSPVWAEVLESAAKQVAQYTPMVVLGEPGTGKLSLLRLVHIASGQPEGTFQVMDCAAPTQVASLATAVRDLAAGTLVLRHLDALSDTAAGSFAAVLAERSDQPGSRIVATTSSSDTHSESPEHRRLFDALAVARIEVPPLRRRSEDIPELATALAGRHGSRSLFFSTKAMRAMQRAPWPGNVRQLEAVIRGLVAAGQIGEIDVEMLPPEIRSHSRRRPLTPMEQLELDAILAALRRTWGNKVRAAQTLGISRSTLYRKMSSYQLDPDLNFF